MMEAPDWSRLTGHADNRSQRYPGDTDIPVPWAVEAWEDENAALIDPDYNSKSGKSLRLIGWSDSAGFLITVIAVHAEDSLFAASAWKSNKKDQRLYEEG
ncbi:MAG: hypothetical protein LBN10_05735 [Propionibacteriaceae bacterium]|jgi:hypothetical protein|nr:hypothetical protein [Propionibacteriaceae bacterium]